MTEESDDPKFLAESMARESFYCPGHFNEAKFSKDYALFIILRKQCIRYSKIGEMNAGLALNNLIILLNAFGRTSVNEIIRLTYEPKLQMIVNAFLKHLRADVPNSDFFDKHMRSALASSHPRYNLHEY